MVGGSYCIHTAATICDGILVRETALVGAGSVVIGHIEPSTFVSGNSEGVLRLTANCNNYRLSRLPLVPLFV